MQKYIFTLISILLTHMLWAQSEVVLTDTVDIQEEVYVRVYKDSRLDLLKNRAGLLARIEAEEAKKAAANHAAIVSSDGKKKVTGSIYTTKGFRIIIYNGPDRNEAMEAKNKFTRAFPGVASYVSYNVPSYKIKIGNFESRGEAATFMKSVNKLFPTSFIVPDLVTIKNINVIN